MIKLMKNLKHKKIIDAGGEWITILDSAKKILKVTKQDKNIYSHLETKEEPKKYIKFKRNKTSIDKGLKEIYKWINR
jgi:hypothetical protein